MVRYVIGVDVGGTNTDAVVLAGSAVIAAAKSPTTEDKTSGVVNAIRAALESLADQKRAEVVAHVARVSIGTTHFVNAVLERNRERLSRVVVIRLCGSASRALPPFSDFPSDLREIVYGGAYMVSGGLEYSGVPIAAISEREIRGCVQEILKLDPPVRNLVISGVFSPRDDPLEGQEVQAARIVRAACPDISCTLSHGLGFLGLLERENACILNEAIRPLAKVTIAAFRQALDQLGLTCEFYLTQNDGTLISAAEATQYPVLTFSSGPTNSMRGAAFLSGLQNAIVVDIGGTTTDVGVLRGGFPREASSQLEVGGVRTNFCMPDVKSIALGGGSLIQWDPQKACVQVGPTSVGYRLTSEALSFGGQQCTATDVAIASGMAPGDICASEEYRAAVGRLSPSRVYVAMRRMRLMLEAAIDSMKVEKEDVPVLLVGGGSILVDLSVPLRGASRVVVPEHHWNVANAVGAALGTVGGTSDLIMNLLEIQEELRSQGVEEGAELDRRSREVALERGRENAKRKARAKGAVEATVYIHTEDVSDVAYVSHRVRVKVKAIGSLEITDSKGGTDVPVIGVEKPRPHPMPEQLSQDNPHWPNCSAEDRTRDEAARLPPPRIQDGVWVLSSHDIECLALGAATLGCGGGGDPNIGRVMAQRVLKEGKEIRIVNPCRMDASRTGLLTTVAFMGAPAIEIEKLPSGNETLLALRTLQQAVACGVCRGEGEEGGVAVTSRTLPSGAQVWLPDCEALSRIDVGPGASIPLDRRITTLLCAEVGGCNSIEPLLASAQTGLPVIDADCMGRAFPELQMTLPFVYGSRHYPSCVADNKGEVICCSYVRECIQLEEFFRVECDRMGLSAAISLGTFTLPEVLERCVLFSMSQAWQLGRAVLGARVTHSSVLDTIVSQQHGTLVLAGKVTSVIREIKGGFLTVVVVVEGLDAFAGHQVKLQAKNEYYIVRYLEPGGGGGGRMVDGPVLACTPDLICVIDSDLGFPITTEAIRYGMRVGVLALPANPRWKTPQALAVVGPEAFGFTDVEYAPPRSLYDIGKMQVHVQSNL